MNHFIYIYNFSYFASSSRYFSLLNNDHETNPPLKKKKKNAKKGAWPRGWSSWVRPSARWRRRWRSCLGKTMPYKHHLNHPQFHQELVQKNNPKRVVDILLFSSTFIAITCHSYIVSNDEESTAQGYGDWTLWFPINFGGMKWLLRRPEGYQGSVTHAHMSGLCRYSLTLGTILIVERGCSLQLPKCYCISNYIIHG